MLKFKQFTGGVYETNGYLLQAPEGNILIDAPDGIADFIGKTPVNLLVLTHGHFDHITDAAKIKALHQCPVACHPETVPMIEERDFFQRFGFQLETEPVKADRLLEETASVNLLGLDFQVLYVPGHCPGSICLFEKKEGLLFGGDVLFCGGVGRWDLPGGDREILMTGIRKKILTLPASTRVFSGHGLETTVGHEAKTNPFLSKAAGW